MKCLFVGAGRRTEMVQIFQSKGCEVVCYEMGDYQPVSKLCRVIQGKKWGDECRRDLADIIGDYDLVIPFMDAAALDLSYVKDFMVVNHKGIIVSPFSTTEICYNKKLFENWMMANFSNYYPLHTDYYSTYIVKPIFGYGSKDVIIFEGDYYDSQQECNNPDKVVQDYVDGDEYTVDVYVNRNGLCVGAVPRLREEVAHGEILNGRTIIDKTLMELSAEISEKLLISGPACLQWIIEESTNCPYLIEVNARFGGGFPLSIAAGFNTPQYCIDEYFLNDLVIPSQIRWKNNVVMRRTFQSYFFNTEEEDHLP